MKILSALLISASLATAAVAAPMEAEKADAAMAPFQFDKATWVKVVASANLFEIESSKLAVQRSSSEDVKLFAQKMIDDHTKAGEKLAEVLKKQSAALPGEKLAAKHAGALKLLTAADKANFDTVYIMLQNDAHVEAVTTFRTYAAKPDDKGVGQFAKQTLPTLEMHLDHVKQLVAAH